MNLLARLNQWFDIRPNEMKPLLISFLGAFLIIGFMIMARSLREAVYLTTFDVKTLPYITLAVAFLGLPTVGIFSHLLARYPSQYVLMGLLSGLSVGLAILWPIALATRTSVVVFYLWTALGTIVLTSGFWIVVSEHFPLRGAKRLFGLISAGGTAGAMVVGTSLGTLTDFFDTVQLIPFLIGFLMLFFVVLLFMPKALSGEGAKPKSAGEAKTSIGEGLRLILKNHHLRSIALIVGAATLATTLLDYQFKELVRGTLDTKEGLTSFFGAFYGWTGGISLFIQLVLTSRVMSKFGLGVALAVLPFILFLGSLAILLIPTLYMVTGVRGLDNSLRKSLYRSALEVLYVPIPSLLRRKTKAFIDSTVDTFAEGFGAVLIFLWVTWANYPSRFLSIVVGGMAAFFLYQARQMNREYYKTLVVRLAEGEKESSKVWDSQERMEGRDLLSASFTSIDLEESLKERGIVFKAPEEVTVPPKMESEDEPLQLLRSNDALQIGKALEMEFEWAPDYIPYLLRIVPRDVFFPHVSKILIGMGEGAVPILGECLSDESKDFVIRRRIPRILAKIDAPKADEALLDSLVSARFEIRYRSAIALAKRSKAGLCCGVGDRSEKIWEAIRFEVARQKAVWEMQQVLDKLDDTERDGFVSKHVGIRGELSLEHVFRLLALVLEPEPVQAALKGVLTNDPNLKSFALEYLEHVLPRDIKDKLWPFIGDISEYQKRQAQRPINEVVEDLVKTGASLFSDDMAKERIRQALGKGPEKK